MKINDKIKVHIFNCNKKEIKTRHFDKIFKVYEKNGKLGIDWNTERNPLTCDGNVFVPLEVFADTVVFEKVS
ncbi:MAG: hypothetical protein J6B63_04620 [Treponema sp.]|nr:hypothetical protein [Treponema sp.]